MTSTKYYGMARIEVAGASKKKVAASGKLPFNHNPCYQLYNDTGLRKQSK
jgi:hypothetical protein